MFQDGSKKTISTGPLRERFPRPRAEPSSLRFDYPKEIYLRRDRLLRTEPVLTGSAAAPLSRGQAEIRPDRHWFPSVPFQRFQALFNSLFKVLCIFPSRYLFAIGLQPIFSFGWNLPPALSCNPKQLDSSKASRAHQHRATNGGITLLAALFQGTSARAGAGCASTDYNSLSDFKRELFPLHSPLLGESLLVSFPPLNYMLKFSGSSCLIGGPDKSRDESFRTEVPTRRERGAGGWK